MFLVLPAQVTSVRQPCFNRAHRLYRPEISWQPLPKSGSCTESLSGNRALASHRVAPGLSQRSWCAHIVARTWQALPRSEALVDRRKRRQRPQEGGQSGMCTNCLRSVRQNVDRLLRRWQTRKASETCSKSFVFACMSGALLSHRTRVDRAVSASGAAVRFRF